MSLAAEVLDPAPDQAFAPASSVDAVRGALAALHEPELQVLRQALVEAMHEPLPVIVWVEHAIAWELDRRAGRRYALHPPVEAIAPEELSRSILMLAALSARFDPAASRVSRFFGAVITSLSATQVMH